MKRGLILVADWILFGLVLFGAMGSALLADVTAVVTAAVLLIIMAGNIIYIHNSEPRRKYATTRTSSSGVNTVYEGRGRVSGSTDGVEAK